MRKKNDPKRYEKLPLYFYILMGINLVALLVYVIAANVPRFANAVNGGIGEVVRGALAHLTNFLPFSLAEILVYLVPFFLVGFAVYVWRCRCNTWREMFVLIGCIFSVAGIFFSLFVFSFGTGYYTDPLDERLGIERREVGEQELYDTAMLLAGKLNEAAAEVTFGADGFSVMPYDRGEMNDLLIAAYDPVCDAYPFVSRLNSRVKPVLASHAMSYTHVTGVYSFFTGEANVNTYFPDYTLPYTAAHELAHQRGIAREEEANFIAFLVTESASDPYIRYSGRLNLFEYVASALYGVNEERYFEVLAVLDPHVIGEIRAYNEFFSQFRNSGAAAVSDAMNDTYLKLHGSEAGSASYGLVVDLAVAYYRK